MLTCTQVVSLNVFLMTSHHHVILCGVLSIKHVNYNIAIEPYSYELGLSLMGCVTKLIYSECILEFNISINDIALISYGIHKSFLSLYFLSLFIYFCVCSVCEFGDQKLCFIFQNLKGCLAIQHFTSTNLASLQETQRVVKIEAAEPTIS